MANVRMIVADKGTLTTGDTAVKDRLETTLGHTVTVVDLSDPVAIGDADLLALVSGSRANYDGKDYSGQDIPMLILSRMAWFMLGHSDGTNDGSATGPSGQDNLFTIGSAHPLHDDNDGQTTLTGVHAWQWRQPEGAPASLAYHWSVVSVGTTGPVHSVGAGASLNDGKTASRPRVSLTPNDADSFVDFNAAGWGVFDAAVAWTLPETTTTKLATPANFAFTAAAGTRQLDGSWDAVTDAETYDYLVEYETSPGVWSAFVSGSTAGTTFQLTSANSVDWGTKYRSRVRAVPAG